MDTKSYIFAALAAAAGYAVNPALLNLGEEEPAYDKWQKWLDQVVEEPIDTHIPVIDPHHHIWDPLYVFKFNSNLTFDMLYLRDKSRKNFALVSNYISSLTVP